MPSTELPMRSPTGTVRVNILVRGIVQGVGFRPFVHQTALSYGLRGWVLNSSEGVEIDIEGAGDGIEAFVVALTRNPPPLAQIDRVDVQRLPPVGYSSFGIKASSRDESGFPLVSPDIATCPDCLSELADAGDRRWRYPFINCTNCGPRFSIVEDVPYDRLQTTMRIFTMCPDCQREYEDPSNRRFHAQPNACAACGPQLRLVASPGNAHHPDVPEPADPVDAARALLRSGHILAIKGLGGFHLACDATNPEAVDRLRVRKGRVDKPFAIMVRDLDAATRFCHLNEAEAQLLCSSRRPIVLLDRRSPAGIVCGVAPGNKRLGVMLPYAPLHHLLLDTTRDCPIQALVMTSGNLSEEPIAKDDDEALSRLCSLADYFLLHNRPIHTRCDDSVTQVLSGKEVVVRRSRGYTPLPVKLSLDLAPVLACGAELKNTFCLAAGRFAFPSQHIGDLENQETLDFLAQSVEQLARLFKINPQIVAHDLHPDYLSTRFALSFDRSKPVVAVQHHHAHVASCMAENGLVGRVIGVAFDGTGYGLDGTIWGGEFLLADFLGFERIAHLKPLPLPGGAIAIQKPYRFALSHLLAAYGADLPKLELLSHVDPYELEIIATQIARKVNTPLTSSCGRLFDAVSALLGIRREITYEGQAAIELEMASMPGIKEGYEFSIDTAISPWQIDAAPVIRSIVADIQGETLVGVIAARFHNAVAEAIAGISRAVRRHAGVNTVCLSGGVFQNRLLLTATLDSLTRDSFETYTHHLVPCNDGGLSLGQAVIASERVRTMNGSGAG